MMSGATVRVLGPNPELGLTTVTTLIEADDDTLASPRLSRSGAHGFVTGRPERYHTPLVPGGVAVTPTQRTWRRTLPTRVPATRGSWPRHLSLWSRPTAPAQNWYLATCLLRRAAMPLRLQAEHWPRAVTKVVRPAQEALP
jgi:hypothetical protein